VGHVRKRRTWEFMVDISLKGTETLITPATCSFTNRSLYGPRTVAGLEHARDAPQRGFLVSGTQVWDGEPRQGRDVEPVRS
jgi:hypothetical protein